MKSLFASTLPASRFGFLEITMQITFLGTSSGVPTKQRNVSALAVAPENTKRWYLVDCGEATQHQLLHTPLSLMHLEAVMITHVHGDHCYGLPGLLATAATYGRTEPLTIVGPAALKAYIEAVCLHTQLVLPYVLHFHAVEVMAEPLTLADFALARIPLSHRVPSFGYQFREINRRTRLDTEKLKREVVPRGPLWGRLQQGEDVVLEDGRELSAADYQLPVAFRTIIVGGDNDTPKLLQKYISDNSLLIHEATYTEEVSRQVGPSPQHSSARQIAEFAEQMKLPNLILTHFSQRYHRPDGSGIESLYKEARRFYTGSLYLASDLEVYHLDLEGALALAGRF